MTRHTVRFLTLAAVLLHSLMSNNHADAQRIGGFDVSTATISISDIHSGGPPKDGIPALTSPEMLPAARVGYLTPNDRVVGVSIGGKARAYPLRILNWHELINDRVGGVPVLVTYCPLCDSAVVFDRRVDGTAREFGVSGLLYNSNVLMYDRGSRSPSLWSQLAAKAVAGPYVGRSLKSVPAELVKWSQWKKTHPNSVVMSTNTGHRRPYDRNPYGAYFSQDTLMFPVSRSSSHKPKDPVLGVWTARGDAKAYRLADLGNSSRVINDVIAGKPIQLQYDAGQRTLRVVKAHPDLQWAYAFWFAWYAFRPDTDVWSGELSRK